jgi:iron-sulfur cluster assembly protein
MKITRKAFEKLKEFQPNTSDVLLVSIQAGGCSGLTYNMAWQDYRIPYDKQILMDHETSIIVGTDNKSALFLGSVELDFSEGLNGKGFVFSNSQAKRTCGCGESFS